MLERATIVCGVWSVMHFKHSRQCASAQLKSPQTFLIRSIDIINNSARTQKLEPRPGRFFPAIPATNYLVRGLRPVVFLVLG
jgi:hypothetical protein